MIHFLLLYSLIDWLISFNVTHEQTLLLMQPFKGRFNVSINKREKLHKYIFSVCVHFIYPGLKGILYVQTNLTCDDLLDTPAIFSFESMTRQLFLSACINTLKFDSLLSPVFVIQTCSLYLLPGAASIGHSGGRHDHPSGQEGSHAE